jgi:hypothetical protein
LQNVSFVWSFLLKWLVKPECFVIEDKDYTCNLPKMLAILELHNIHTAKIRKRHLNFSTAQLKPSQVDAQKKRQKIKTEKLLSQLLPTVHRGATTTATPFFPLAAFLCRGLGIAANLRVETASVGRL